MERARNRPAISEGMTTTETLDPCDLCALCGSMGLMTFAPPRFESDFAPAPEKQFIIHHS
jgi:hypothetical protein